MGAARRIRRGLYMAAAAMVAGPLLAFALGIPATSLENVRTSADRTPIAFAPDALTPAPTSTTTSTTEATTTTTALPTTTTTSRPVAVVVRRHATVTAAADSVSPTGYGCAAALAYLEAHANSSARLVCPGWASGHQAETCYHAPPTCGPNDFVIRIWDPCPAAYMNEAWNSNHFGGPYDPYGYCH